MKKRNQVRRNGSLSAAASQAHNPLTAASQLPGIAPAKTEKCALVRCCDEATGELFAEFKIIGEERAALFDRAAATGFTVGQFIEFAIREKIASTHKGRVCRFVNAVLPDDTTANRLVALVQVTGADLERVAGLAIRKTLAEPELDELIKEGLGIGAKLPGSCARRIHKHHKQHDQRRAA